MSADLKSAVCELLFAKFESGERLITEEMLAGALGVGRLAIREVLHYLKLVGVVESRRKRGITIRKFTEAEVADFYDVRAAVEGLAAKLAAERATADDIRVLTVHAKNYEKWALAKDPDKAHAADYAFHGKIVQISGNGYLQKLSSDFLLLQRAFLIEGMLNRKQSLRALAAVGMPAGSVVKHAAVLEALAARNPELAESIIRRHVMAAKIANLRQIFGGSGRRHAC